MESSQQYASENSGNNSNATKTKNSSNSSNVQNMVNSAMEEFINNPSEMKWEDLVAKVNKNKLADKKQRRSQSNKKNKKNNVPPPGSFHNETAAHMVDDLVAAALSIVPDLPPFVQIDPSSIPNASTTVQATNRHRNIELPIAEVDNNPPMNNNIIPSVNPLVDDDTSRFTSRQSSVGDGSSAEEWGGGITNGIGGITTSTSSGGVAPVTTTLSSSSLHSNTPQQPQPEKEWGDDTDFFPDNDTYDDNNDAAEPTIDFFPGKEGGRSTSIWGNKARTMYDAQKESEEIEKCNDTNGGSSVSASEAILFARWRKWIVCGSISLIGVMVTGVAVAVTQEEIDAATTNVGEGSAGEMIEENMASSSNSELDLSVYGYPYSFTTGASSVGWISWPRDLNDDNFASFDDDDGVTSVAECAAKCRELDAETGAWDVQYEACWCAFVDPGVLCREPCVQESYVDFSSWDITLEENVGYCEMSVCDEDWFHSDSYCADRVQFVEDACDEKIKALGLQGEREEGYPGSTTSIVGKTSWSPTSFKGKMAKEANLMRYHYPYVGFISSSAGWLSWPQNSAPLAAHNDNVTTVEQCSGRCSEIEAVAGVWDLQNETCRCAPSDANDAVCKEPCVEGEYFGFSLVPHDQFYYCERSVCDEEWKNGKSCFVHDLEYYEEACDAKIKAIEMPPAITGGPLTESRVPVMTGGPLTESVWENILAHGYHYAQPTTSLWPRDVDDLNLKSFDADDLVTSVEECVVKCRSLNADTGAWEVENETCWCSLSFTSHMCKEPCVEEEFVSFSTLPYAEFDYCDVSVCDEGWFHSEDEGYCVDNIQFDKDECEMKIQALDDVATEVDLSMYGYDYARHTTSVGWVSWPPEASGDSFLSFEADDGVTSLEECAAKCQGATLGSSTLPPLGAWDVLYQACFCSFVDLNEMCKEPCVEEEYIEFATVPFSTFDYCEESVCDKDWYHSEEYCVNQVNFDKDACDAKINALASLTSAVAIAPATSPTTPKSAEKFDIEPSAMATTKYSSPDAKNEGLLNFSVENGEERVSFVRFDLSSIPESSVVDSATLHLHLVRSIADSESETVFSVSVHSLPQSSEDWSTGSVSYNEPLESKGEFFVKSFDTVPIDPSTGKMLYMVDVTPGIDLSQNAITFKLSTDSDIRLDFVGWNGGEALPHLVVMSHEQTNEPTTNPTKEPTKYPSQGPTNDPNVSAISSYSTYASSSPSSSTATPKHTGSVLSENDIEPSAMATTKYSSPDAKNEGLLNFSVENGEERVSFLRFDLSSISAMDVVGSATLHLHLVRGIADSESETVFNVYVHSLPQSIEDWSTGSVSYNEPLELEGESLVESFEVVLLDGSAEKKTFAVDVKSAIDLSQNAITFKLSTDSDVRLDFAGSQWNGGKETPWLRVTVSETSYPQRLRT